MGWAFEKRIIEKGSKNLSAEVYLERLSLVGLSQEPGVDSMDVVMDLGTTACSVRSSTMMAQWHKSPSSLAEL